MRISFIKLIFFMMLLFVPINFAFANGGDLDFKPVSFNPIGSGARAMGMGGAFIAVADDATAASWNPGGLLQLDYPEISMVEVSFHRSEYNSFGTDPEGNGPQRVHDDFPSSRNINYLSLVYPFNVSWKGRYINMVFAVNYQNLYDFTYKRKFSILKDDQLGWINIDIDYKQKGNLSAIGAAWGVKATPLLYFGITLNWWDDSFNKWKRIYDVEHKEKYNGSIIHSNYSENDEYSFEGINYNIGILFHTHDDKLKIGAVFKTPFTADLEHQYIQYEEKKMTLNRESNEELDMPSSYGIGISYRFTDNFTMSADIYRTNWEDHAIRNSKGELSPITNKNMDDTDIDPTHQVRIGGEYIFPFPKWKCLIPIRGGVFYDPAPSEGKPDDFYGLSLGIGFTQIGNTEREIGYHGFSFDLAFQYRYGNDVGASMIPDSYDFSQDVHEYMVYSSLILYF
ncbi:MAG: hypothetical protein GY795_27740 [Desulfobacterales bacterium]|nr:hypothetical protein [Desulfobacterales bacterium]